LNKRERILRTLNIEEPDRLPISELIIEVPLMQAITGKELTVPVSVETPVIDDWEVEKKIWDYQIECYKKVDFDMINTWLSVPEGWKLKRRADGTIVDIWGKVLMLDKRSKQWSPHGTVFNTPEDFERFELPDPTATGWVHSTEYVKKTVGDTMAVSTMVRDPFAHLWEMFTPTKFVMWMYEKPDVIKRAHDRMTDYFIEIIKQAAEAGADLIIGAGDFAEEKNPMIPVDFFRKVIFPNLKKQINVAHKRGLKFIKHSDGNINPLIDDLAKIVDGLHSLDPSAGVDIGKVKARYGDKLILMGNVSVDNLARNSREEIIEETKDCIRKASPGGGHILSSSNSWAAGAKLENCLAMVETGRKHGRYPISI